MRKKTPLHTSSESESMRDRWMISYADLVTLLLALFIVLYAASDRERARAIADSFSTQATGGNGVLPGGDTVKDQARLLDNPILSEHTKIKQTEKGLIVSLVEAGVFAPGEATINPEAEGVITALADSLKNENIPIRVEGHTDSKPISNAKYSSNWELSTARAAAVL
ncbi:MAG TPA: flagellar motor protein MotB, partial [Pyrinomonadaceae bacterium]|nr:flagellar motor protein MotB [Pyrinomonadaceae bacterium]